VTGSSHERGCGERLGVARDAEERVRGDGIVCAEASHAVAFGVHHLAVFHDGDGNARNCVGLARALDELIHPLLRGAERGGKEKNRGEFRAHACTPHVWKVRGGGPPV
jgi:hypothetical protein